MQIWALIANHPTETGGSIRSSMPIERLRILDERFIQKDIEFDVHVFSTLQVDLIIVKQLA
jgi:hypothetical protein